MDTPSPAQRHPMLLKVLSVTVALGFLGTVMCTAGGGGSGSPPSGAARPATNDGGSADSGAPAASATEPVPERFLPATKSLVLDLPGSAPLPEPQAAPQQQVAPR